MSLRHRFTRSAVALSLMAGVFCRARGGPGGGHHPADRLPGAGRVQRAELADGPGVRARRADLRGREGRPHQGLRQPRRHDPDGLRRPVDQRAQPVGPGPARAGAAAELPDQPVGVRAVRLRRAARAGRATVERCLPGRQQRALHRHRPAVPAPGHRQHDDRHASRCSSTTGASSSPATPSATSSSAPTACSTLTARRRRQLQRRSTTASCPPATRRTRAPTRRTRAGRMRSQDVRTTADETQLDGTPAAARPGHRRGGAGQPA